MAENVVINIEANTSGLQSTIDLMVKLGLVTEDAAKKFKATNDQTMSGLNKAATETKKSFDSVAKAIDNVKKDNGLAKALDVTKEVAKVGNGMASLKAQFAEAKKEAQALAAEFGELDPRVLAAAQRASEFKQTIEDTDRVIKALDPGEKFRTVQTLGAAIGGAFQVATGALQAFGVESEQAQKIAQQFQGALNIFGGLQQLAELKDSLVAVQAALGLTKVQAAAAGTALEGEAAAAGAAGAANKGFAASLSATGIGAIVVALGAIVAAFIAYNNAAEESVSYTKAIADESKKLNGEYAKEKVEVDILVTKYKDANLTQTERVGVVKKLQEIAPDTFANLSTEKAAVDEVNKAYVEYVKNLDTSIKVQATKNAALATYEQILALRDAETGPTFAGLQTSYIVEIEGKTKQLSETEYKRYQQLQQSYNQLTGLAAKYSKAAEDASKAGTGDKGGDGEKKTPFDIDIEKLNAKYDQARAAEAKAYDTEYKDAEVFQERLRQLELKRLRELADINIKYGKDASDILLKLNKDAQDTGTLQPIQKTVSIDLVYPDPTDEDKLEGVLNPNLVPTRPLTVDIEFDTPLPDEIQGRIDVLKQQIQDALIDGGGELARSYFDQYLEGITYATEQQKDQLDQQEKDLQESYNNRLIGRVELEQKEQEIALKKAALERKLKTDQAKADRQRALFDVAINTASAIIRAWVSPGFPAAVPLVPYIVGLGAIQAGTILAQPLPKYKKGTLSVPGSGTEDTHMAMLTPGEAVIPRDTNAKYREAIGAIYHGKISPNDLNTYVRMKLKNDYGSKSSSTGPVTAKMDTADLYALGKIIKRNDGVVIKNVGELASIFASLHNPRR